MAVAGDEQHATRGGRGERGPILDVPHCPIATDALNAALPGVRDGARARSAAHSKFYAASGGGGGQHDSVRKPRGATLLLRDHFHTTEPPLLPVCTDHSATLQQRVPVAGRPGGEVLVLEHRAGDFFQNNAAVVPLLVAFVRFHAASSDDGAAPLPAYSGAQTTAAAAAAGAAAAQAGVGHCTHLVDAYCGVGLFGLACADLFERVAGIEISESSIATARANAARNGVSNTSFVAATASAIFGTLDAGFVGARTCVIVDPPRAGCDDSFLEQLFAFGPRRVIYVSCDPATQARDAQHFTAAGYVVSDAQPFDMFPQTRHIESVLVFEKR